MIPASFAISLAGILNSVFESIGTVIRFAGDEFVVIDELMYKDKNDFYKTNERKR